MSIDINKRTKGNYFWSGECLMQNNDNDTFSSSHVDIGEIKPNEHQKKFIVTACNHFDAMLSYIKEMAKRYENSEWIAGEANKIIQSIEKENENR